MGARELATALFLLFLGLGVFPAAAQPFAVPFELKPGTSLHFTIEHGHRDSLSGKALAEEIVRCNLRVSVDTASKAGIVVLIHHESTDLTVDGERGVPPLDLANLMLLAVDTLVARVEMTAGGVPVRVTNWDMLRDTIAARAHAEAGGNATLIRLADEYLAGLDAEKAVPLLAEPLALAAAGRSTTFDLPDETLIVRGGLSLPSFLPALWSSWAFTLADDPPSPDLVTVAWEGVAGRETMAPMLPGLAAEIGMLAPATSPNLADQAASVRQLFRADFARGDGKLVALHGTMTLTAGPLIREESIDLKAVP
jgi:hypothetical protein